MPPQQRAPPQFALLSTSFSHQHPCPSTSGDFFLSVRFCHLPHRGPFLPVRISHSSPSILHPLLQTLLLLQLLHLSVTLSASISPFFASGTALLQFLCLYLGLPRLHTTVSSQPLSHAPDHSHTLPALPGCSRVSAPRRRRHSSSRSHCSAIRARRSPATARETAPHSPGPAPRPGPAPGSGSAPPTGGGPWISRGR